MFATDPAVVADQAASVAAAWSPPGAPASWKLTATQFEVLRGDPELLAIAAGIEPERLPSARLLGLAHPGAAWLEWLS